MTAPTPQSKPTAVEGYQPDNREVRQEVAAIHRVGEIVVELNDCGFESAIELIDTLTKQRDAAESRIEELTKALELQEKADLAHVNCEECDGEEVPEFCPKCFPLFDDARIARRVALGTCTIPLEDRK